MAQRTRKVWIARNSGGDMGNHDYIVKLDRGKPKQHTNGRYSTVGDVWYLPKEMFMALYPVVLYPGECRRVRVTIDDAHPAPK